MSTLPTTVAITMAGFGSRFRDAGYTIPKYMIEAKGATLFEWSLAGLDCFIKAGSRFLFVVRAADGAEPFIRDRVARLGVRNVEIVSLGAPTDGQATTGRIAADHADAHAPFAIFNIDTAVAPCLLDPADARGVGWIPCFHAPGDNWSFARADETGRALELREKSRISDDATIGFYWFDTASRYATAYDAYYGLGGREERGERYVAPLYNQLIAEGLPVYVTRIDASSVRPLGTPAELAAFLAADARSNR